MKLTKSTLKRLIKEEMQKVLQEVTPSARLGGAQSDAEDWATKIGADAAKKAARAATRGASRARAGALKRSPDSQAPMSTADGRSIGADDWEAEDILGLDDPGMSPGKQRRAINDAFKRGDIDKDEWRRLRRKYHRSRKSQKGTGLPVATRRQRAAGKKSMAAKKAADVKAAEERATRKGYLPGSAEWKKAVRVGLRS